jgi:hypothetical protein
MTLANDPAPTREFGLADRLERLLRELRADSDRASAQVGMR